MVKNFEVEHPDFNIPLELFQDLFFVDEILNFGCWFGLLRVVLLRFDFEALLFFVLLFLFLLFLFVLFWEDGHVAGIEGVEFEEISGCDFEDDTTY